MRLLSVWKSFFWNCMDPPSATNEATLASDNVRLEAEISRDSGFSTRSDELSYPPLTRTKSTKWPWSHSILDGAHPVCTVFD